jgi:hypothetical protein
LGALNYSSWWLLVWVVGALSTKGGRLCRKRLLVLLNGLLGVQLFTPSSDRHVRECLSTDCRVEVEIFHSAGPDATVASLVGQTSDGTEHGRVEQHCDVLDYGTLREKKVLNSQAKKLKNANASKAFASFANFVCLLLMQVLAPAVEIHMIQRKALIMDQPTTRGESEI